MPSTTASTQQTFESPSPFLLPERLNLESPDSIASLSSTPRPLITFSCPPTNSGFTPLPPTRPSAITNKMTPYNSIRRAEPAKESRRLLTRLPSVKNERKPKAFSNSGSSTPDLSRSTSTTTSTTPVLSPESLSEAISSQSSEVSGYRLIGRKQSMESLASSDNSSQYSCLSKDDQYLLYLKDVEGLSCWDDIAEKMCHKGYNVQKRGLRTRYCILKRDLDLSLQRSMENLVNIQSEVDEVLGSTHCPVRRLASFKNKKIGSNLRVYDEEQEAVDPRVWEDLAASLHASGMR
ncbi:hypothetical protein DRE_01181 [Drechslerella stenobrocha 248]|uniref:Myb-like domain-containing protein n=1 Tax=Drechslerella stenobrocha 248 TaxID=1043628 RepID=W7I6E4_9PEZI|nr:hypothetical protein DRE_01181 [Drechslerella stenobrocha 248]